MRYTNCLEMYVLGGLFHAENSDAEAAFRNALDLENRYHDKFELRPIVRRLDSSDSFAAEKMGKSVIIYYL